MSDEVKLNIVKASGIIGLLAGLAGLLGAWFVLPYRVGAAETKLAKLETEAQQTREILIRIDENVKQLRAEKH